jgi:hypothetical protein
MMIYAIHAPEPERLEKVSHEMRMLGAPTIRVVDCGDHYQALEGSHRLAAAHALGITPQLVIYAQHELISISDYDSASATTTGTIPPIGLPTLTPHNTRLARSRESCSRRTQRAATGSRIEWSQARQALPFEQLIDRSEEPPSG